MRKPCCDKEGTNKGAWSKQEDHKLFHYISSHGEGSWHSLPKATGLSRCGKSCRLRWINYLKPDIKRGNFGQDEEELIVKLHALLGNRWSLIAGRLPGRTDNEVKNYWNSHIRRKLVRMGIDPNNHRLHQIRPIINKSISNVVHSEEEEVMSESNKNTVNAEPMNTCADTSVQNPTAEGGELSEDHLNLDLAISVPNSVSLAIDAGDRRGGGGAPAISAGNDMSPATLLLFT